MKFKSLDKLFAATSLISTIRNKWIRTHYMHGYDFMTKCLTTMQRPPSTIRNNNQLFRSGPSLLQKGQCYSKTNKEDSEEQVKKLLDDSSPLKSVANDFWATEPYPYGTVFQNSQSKSEPSLNDKEQGSVIMFPGQGNQFVGMAKNLLQYTVVREMFDAANDILGCDLLKICLEGPEDKLNRTKYCQPATYVCSLGALEKLKHEKPWAISNCAATCGYSLGEITSLVFAGVIKFEEGLKLIKVRAKAMELCCKKQAGGMMSVFYGSEVAIGKALEDAMQHCLSLGISNPECRVAVHLFPHCKVIAGNIEALNFLIQNSKKYGFKRLSKLPVSGAFHTALMEDAAEPVQKILEKIKLSEPLIKVYSNVTGKRFFDARDIRKKLPAQIYKPVKWEQIMCKIYQREKGVPFPFSYECGPGNSLSVALKKINNVAAENCYSVQL